MTFLSDILTGTLKFGNFKGKESTGNISLSDFKICNISFGSVYDHMISDLMHWIRSKTAPPRQCYGMIYISTNCYPIISLPIP